MIEYPQLLEGSLPSAAELFPQEMSPRLAASLLSFPEASLRVGERPFRPLPSLQLLYRNGVLCWGLSVLLALPEGTGVPFSSLLPFLSSITNPLASLGPQITSERSPRNQKAQTGKIFPRASLQRPWEDEVPLVGLAGGWEGTSEPILLA